MEKFSIYEFLSFFLPGFLGWKAIQHFCSFWGFQTPFTIGNSTEDTLWLLVISLFIGVIVHVFTFQLIQKVGWYKVWVYTPEWKIVNDSDELRRIVPAVKNYYNNIKVHQEGTSVVVVHPNDYNIQEETYLFDYIYHCLEVNGKIDQTKNFQSLYFLFRNALSIIILYLVVTAVAALLWMLSIINNTQSFDHAHIFSVAILSFSLACIVAARFMRKKMIHRAFWSYYLLIISKTKNNES